LFSPIFSKTFVLFIQYDILHEIVSALDIPLDLSCTQEALPINPVTQDPTFPGVSFDLEEVLPNDLHIDLEAILADLPDLPDLDGLIGPNMATPPHMNPEELEATNQEDPPTHQVTIPQKAIFFN
jgi:hypothetical protein